MSGQRTADGGQETKIVPIYSEHSFHDLKVFREAFDTSVAIHKQTQGFPKTEQYGGVADQLRRSTKSVCANIAEGHGKRPKSKPDFIRYLYIAIASADESRLWLDYAYALGFISLDDYNSYKAEYKKIASMLHKLIATCHG
jgi:four helix bundle protein